MQIIPFTSKTKGNLSGRDCQSDGDIKQNNSSAGSSTEEKHNLAAIDDRSLLTSQYLLETSAEMIRKEREAQHQTQKAKHVQKKLHEKAAQRSVPKPSELKATEKDKKALCSLTPIETFLKESFFLPDDFFGKYN